MHWGIPLPHKRRARSNVYAAQAALRVKTPPGASPHIFQKGEVKMITVERKPIQRRSSSMPEKSDYVIVNWRIPTHPHTWRPPTDVYEREESVVVRVEIAGMNENEFSISLDQNILAIHGVRQDTNERRAYHQMEINFGEFLTTIEIQALIDVEHVSAEYQNGFLWVLLPKAQPKIINIKENE
jgi:HSP20 family protein